MCVYNRDVEPTLKEPDPAMPTPLLTDSPSLPRLHHTDKSGYVGCWSTARNISTWARHCKPLHDFPGHMPSALCMLQSASKILGGCFDTPSLTTVIVCLLCVASNGAPSPLATEHSIMLFNAQNIEMAQGMRTLQ